VLDENPRGGVRGRRGIPRELQPGPQLRIGDPQNPRRVPGPGVPSPGVPGPGVPGPGVPGHWGHRRGGHHGEAEAQGRQPDDHGQGAGLEHDPGREPGFGARGVERRPHTGAAGQADQRHATQRADRDRAGIRERMARVHCRDQLLRHDDRGVDPRRGRTRRSDQGEVELAVPEQLDQAVGVALGQGDGHAGIQVVESGQQLGQDRQRAPAHHAHRDLPADQAGQLIDGQPGVRHRVEGSPGEREHGRSRLGQPNRTAGPVKQLLSQLGLQPADLRAHPRLRHVHPGRRPSEAGLFRHRDEVLELVKFHNQRF